MQQKIFKDSAFSQVLLKDFAQTLQNAYWEKYTFQWHLAEIYGYDFYGYFPWQNTPSSKNHDATNKNLKKSRDTVVKSIYYELKSINLYLEGAAFSASTIW